MKKLPLGIQTFSKIIEGDYLYIDKTREILELINAGEVFFFSRPRRFGKSLLVSVLKELFSGNRQLFRNLYIYDKIQWQVHPVLDLDFSVLSDADNFSGSLGLYLSHLAREFGVAAPGDIARDRFNYLIKNIYKKYRKKIVILVDEYDKPIIDFISDPVTAQKNRNILQDFFAVLKHNDQFLQFVFITGVSKFSKVSIFSGLNNIIDITLDTRFATLLGITGQELEIYFSRHVQQLAQAEQQSSADLLGEIKQWYNGYSWDGINQVYNPTSILMLFNQQHFSNYWFTTGTPSFLISTIKDKKYRIMDIEETRVGEHILDSYDIDNLDINALLLQTGYLTVKKIDRKQKKNIYTLGCPNSEVKESLLNYLLAGFVDQPVTKIEPLLLRLVEALENKQVEDFVEMLKALFARIPYNLHLEAEAYYHSLFYMVLSLMGVRINLEVLTDKGRLDGVLELGQLIYVIELKLGSAVKALEQIKAKRYWERYLDAGTEIILLGLGGFAEGEINYEMEVIE